MRGIKPRGAGEFIKKETQKTDEKEDQRRCLGKEIEIADEDESRINRKNVLRYEEEEGEREKGEKYQDLLQPARFLNQVGGSLSARSE